jgi:predicted ATPase/class 3 adenylate cyclase
VAAVTQPSGTVTLVFTDVEGSTRLLEERGVGAYGEALSEHRRVVREACARHQGFEVDAEGDAFFYAFQSAQHAVEAVGEAMRGLEGGPIRVRVGIHTGQPALDPPNYLGLDVHRAARIMASAHGGQVLLSPQTVESLDTDSVELMALGSHRLKDFEQPVVLYQLGSGSFPPLRTLANTNLPTSVSSFVGRHEELAEADRLLRETRLLTVTGPGGAGKTRFAIELGHRVREERFSDYPDGVFACFFSALLDPDLVLATIAYTLSISERAGLSALETLVGQLEGKRMLLLLDNLEHLLSAAPAFSKLLAGCPGLSLVCTSRETLRLQGETVYRLPPLAETESVALFCERARVEPSEPIRELCARLEGLPLALELAAARLSLLSPEQLLQRLSQRLDLLKAGRDADPRQQTLRATIQWSHDLLDPPEQELFARLAVFAGGCTLEAAEQICDAQLDTLHSLIDKNLLRFSNDRYWILETIREYATEQLEARGEADELGRRHADHYLRLAQAAEPQLRGREQKTWLQRLEQDHSNLTAAMLFFLDGGLVAEALRIGAALTPFWLGRGFAYEGSNLMKRALGEVSRVPLEVRARAVHAAGRLAYHQNHHESERAYLEEAIELFRRAGDEWGEVYAEVELGYTEVAVGNRDSARARAERCVERARAFDDGWVYAYALQLCGVILGELGEREQAKHAFGESIRVFDAVGDVHSAGAALGDQGWIAVLQEEYEEALALLVRSVASIPSGAVVYAVNRGNLGLGNLFLGNDAAAIDDLSECLVLCASGRLDLPAAEALFGFAALAARASRPDAAARLRDASLALHEAAAGPVGEIELRMQERFLTKIGPIPANGDAAGQPMTLDEAAAYAMELAAELREPPSSA